MSRRIAAIVGVALCALGLAATAARLSAQGRGGAVAAAGGGQGRGEFGRPSPPRHLLYAAVPGRANDLEYGGVGILVFDTTRNFQLVKRIPTWDFPASIYPENVKGIAASAQLNMIYVSTTKRIAAWDLTTEKKVWEQTYDGNCCDRMALTPDGKTLWIPSFGGPHWYVADAATGRLIKDLQTPATGGAHNTIVSLDGKRAFMAGLGSKTMSIADTTTNTVVQTVGPFAASVRPFTINGDGTLIYANVNDLLGFQIADVKTGKVLHTVEVKGYGWARDRLAGHGCPSHGIALSPDEREVWVTDGANSTVHVFDNTVMPPKQVKSITMRDQPFWLTWSANGKWVYSSSGDIIDAESKHVIAQLKDETGRDVQGEKAVEIVFDNEGRATKAVDQFGVGQKRTSTQN